MVLIVVSESCAVIEPHCPIQVELCVERHSKRYIVTPRSLDIEPVRQVGKVDIAQIDPAGAGEIMRVLDALHGFAVNRRCALLTGLISAQP